MNSDEMRRRVSAFIDEVNSAGIPVALEILSQALDRATLKSEDLRNAMQNVQPAKKSKNRIPCKPYYIQQQRGKQARWTP